MTSVANQRPSDATRAARLGVSVAELQAARDAGQSWCRVCRTFVADRLFSDRPTLCARHANEYDTARRRAARERARP